ncbi:2-oxo-4-hydroxy-4-carboxy-5-ureidoimidazoline decarboxylase [Roseomonas sp. WA12]
MAGKTTLASLNDTSVAEFAALLDGVFEHGPWVATQAAGQRPFASVAALHRALLGVVRQAPEEERLRFLNGHPELTAGPLAAGLTAASRAEQGGSALALVPGAEELSELQRCYRERFGIPFIVCLRRHTPADVIRSLRRRLDCSVDAEREAALDEVGHVSRLRLAARLVEDGTLPTPGVLGIRVRNAVDGGPAAGVRLRLTEEGQPIGEWITDAAGTTAEPLLAGGALRIGAYGLNSASDLLVSTRGTRAWLEGVDLRFWIKNPETSCQITVLIGPLSCEVRVDTV